MSSSSAPVCASAPACALPPRLVTELDVVALLRRGVDEAGSQRLYARQHGLNYNDLCSVLSGRRAPGRSFMRAVGVRSALIIEGVQS